LAGCADLSDYLARINPMRVMNDIAVPVLIINAEDDPVCVIDNARDHVDTVRNVRDALLLRTASGSHCAFLEGWTAQSWANRLIANYLLAAADVERDQETINRVINASLPLWISAPQPV